MRLQSLLVIMLGMALAGLSIYASRELLRVPAATASNDPSQPKLVSVVVAGQDIPFGAEIEARKLTTIQWPVEAVPPGTFADFSDLVPARGAEPRRAKRAMARSPVPAT